MKVDIWADVVCPWCYIGKRRFEQAMARFEHRDEVEVRWHSYELNPDAPTTGSSPLIEFFAEHKGVAPEEAAEMFDHVTKVAATEGLDLRFDIATRGNTFSAHRLLHYAETHGQTEALQERLFTAYFSEGAELNDTDTLVRLATDAGLNGDDARLVLESDGFAAEVRADQTQARAYGINGVPFFVVDGHFGISGAQGPDGIIQVLDHAWAESSD